MLCNTMNTLCNIMNFELLYNTMNIPTLQYNEQTHCNNCNTLQQTATHCNRLQQTATDCNTLQRTTPRCTTLQHTVKCPSKNAPTKHTVSPCSVQHTATYCSALLRTATTYCNVPVPTPSCPSECAPHASIWLFAYVTRLRVCIHIYIYLYLYICIYIYIHIYIHIHCKYVYR